MNKFLKLLEIINQLCAVFFIEVIAELKRLISRNRKSNKLFLNTKNIKLIALALVVIGLIIGTFLILKSKQQIQLSTTSAGLSEWNNNLENASKHFDALDYDKAFALASNALEQAKNDGAELQKFSSQELLSRIYNTKGNYLKAAETYKAIFTSLTVLPGSESSSEMATTIAKSLIGLGLLNQNLALYQQAIVSFQLAAKVSKNKFGENSVIHAMSDAYLADTYRLLGKYDSASTLFETSNQYFEQNIQKNQTENIVFSKLLASFYQDLGQYTKAEKLLSESANSISALSENGKHLKLQNDIALALLILDTGDYKKAESLLQSARETLINTVGENHPESTRVLLYVAELMR
jgi:tetratricopeptide (TPR) repeat protein